MRVDVRAVSEARWYEAQPVGAEFDASKGAVSGIDTTGNAARGRGFVWRSLSAKCGITFSTWELRSLCDIVGLPFGRSHWTNEAS